MQMLVGLTINYLANRTTCIISTGSCVSHLRQEILSVKLPSRVFNGLCIVSYFILIFEMDSGLIRQVTLYNSYDICLNVISYSSMRNSLSYDKNSVHFC